MSERSLLGTLVKGAVGSVLGLAGGWVLYSELGIEHDLRLPPAIDAERERFTDKNDRFLSFYVDRRGREAAVSGPPLVLIHSINAAGSSYEMSPIFQAYRDTRDVYALDLPGFGFSERSDKEYSADLFKQSIIDLLERVGQPADVICLSLSAEFAAKAALERPELFRSLTMISPSGFTARQEKVSSQAARETGRSDFVYHTLAFPLWGQAFYDLVATRPSIHYFLQKSFEGEVDYGLERYSYLTSHQPGAHYAPLYFVSGKLFSPDIRQEVYAELKLPVLVLYDRDAFVRFDRLHPFLDAHLNWQATRIVSTRGLPQFEQMANVAEALDSFWATIDQPENNRSWRGLEA